MKKRLLAIIATVAMVVAMMPSMVFGAEVQVSSADDFLSAVKNAKDGDIIVLNNDIALSDIKGTATPTVGVSYGNKETVTLDLNGKKLTLGNGNGTYLYVQTTGTLIIKDSKGNGKITNDGATSPGPQLILAKGNLEIIGGTIENTVKGIETILLQGNSRSILDGGKIINSGESGTAVQIATNATFEMNSGEIKNLYEKDGKAVHVSSATAAYKMNGGVVESKATGTGGETSAIKGGLIEIAGGKIVTPGTAIEATNDVKVTGGEIEAGTYAFKTNKLVVDPAEGKDVNVEAGKSVFNPYSNNSNNNSIKGGNFDAPMLSKPCEYDDSVVAVTSGTFKNGNANMDVSNFLADGVKQDASGEVIVCTHDNTTEQTGTAEEPTCVKPGKKADEVCNDCGTELAGEVIPASGVHKYEDGVCTMCNDEEPVAKPNGGTETEKAPNTGDNTVAPFAVAGLVLAAMAAAVVVRRRYN